MKKIFLKCFYEKNLGDDLFIDMITKRYPNERFYLINYLNGKIKNKSRNLKVISINNKVYRLFKKIARKRSKMPIIDKIIISKVDFIVTIGGSLFMESKHFFKRKCAPIADWHKNLNKEYVIIGANIGPVYTNEYIEQIKKDVLSKARDVCFRDRKSYDYFKDLDSVRMAPDIVFSYNFQNQKIKPQKKVIFSLINIDKKKAQIPNPNKERYEQIIYNLAEYFMKKKYIVEFMSFCKNEGDEEYIKKIIKTKKWQKKVQTYFYDGCIDKAINELETSEIIVGSRFHANVIGMCMNKTIIPIIYNDKTENLLNDVNFKGKYYNINKLDNKVNVKLTKKDLEYKCDVSKQIREAEKHFQELDKILERSR